MRIRTSARTRTRTNGFRQFPASHYLWVLGKPGGDVVFEFYPGRGKEHAQKLLGGFKGYLQRDGYGVYGSMARDDAGLIPVGCWAHARRKFVEAVEEQNAEAVGIVGELRKLYLIERHAREEALSAEEGEKPEPST